VNELFEYVVRFTQPYTHIRLQVWLARIEESLGKKEVGQESDLLAMRTEITGEGVRPVALGSEDRTQSAAV
jgi:hypothetical protein